MKPGWLDRAVGEFDEIRKQSPPRSEVEILRIAVRRGGFTAGMIGTQTCLICRGRGETSTPSYDGPFGGCDWDKCTMCEGTGSRRGMLQPLYEEYQERCELDKEAAMSPTERHERQQLKRLKQKYGE